uniref:G protein-coupled receptor n=2 Tax=Caenorhabditis tropicalis TaxID=1561998 RepID=A0A1I7T6P8_9PELO
MIIKVKKLSTLPTIRENQPERHIVYHTTVLLLFKLLYIPIILIFAAAFRGINEDITSIYHITRHFCYVVKCMQGIFLFFIFISILIVVFYNHANSIVYGLLALTGPFTYALILAVTVVEHILLSVLAIERCLTFFFDSINFNLSEKVWSTLIKILYTYVILFNWILRTIKISLIGDFQPGADLVTFLEIYDNWNMVIMKSKLRGFENLSEILFHRQLAHDYICIILHSNDHSSEKFSNLQSVQENNPDKFLVVQTTILLAFKLVYGIV